MAIVRHWKRHPFRAWAASGVAAALVLQAFASLASAEFLYPTYGSSWDHICDSTMQSQCKSWSFAARSYEFLGLTPGLVEGTNYAIASVYNPLDIFYFNDPGDGDTGYFDADYGTAGGNYAWTACSPGASYIGSDGSHTRDCTPDDVRYNLHYPDKYNNVDERKAIACHETGHIFGLRHNGSTSSCMHNPPGQVKVLIQGERNLLNANY